jgi:hypothetical protein
MTTRALWRVDWSTSAPQVLRDGELPRTWRWTPAAEQGMNLTSGDGQGGHRWQVMPGVRPTMGGACDEFGLSF